MAELVNRDKWERELAKLLAGEFTRFRNVLLELFPELVEFATGLTQDIWVTHASNLTMILETTLGAIAAEGLFNLEEETDVGVFGVDWTQANERAANWASDYAFDLVSELNSTSSRFLGAEVDKIREMTEYLQQEISEYFMDHNNVAELRRRLTNSPYGFGPVRSEIIAITETTRASSWSRLELKRQWEAHGITTIDYWLTANDDWVCDICRPRNNKPIEDGMYPPAHPRCRCDWRSEPQYSWSE
jgi:hypothetical protein